MCALIMIAAMMSVLLYAFLICFASVLAAGKTLGG